MIKTSLISPATHRALGIEKDAMGKDTFMTQDTARAFGQFKSIGRSTAGSSVIVAPSTGGAIVLTDLMVSTDKVALSSFLIEFEDGVNKIAIFASSTADAPVCFGIAFAGRWRGWRNARLTLATVATVKCTVAVGYYKIGYEFAQDYSDWDAMR